ncbi:hypothetical protein GN958_ATG21224, partial [Phytophthora infestans]
PARGLSPSARASKKRISKEDFKDGSENDGSDANWEDDSTASSSSSAATLIVDDPGVSDTPGERTSRGTSGDGCTEAFSVLASLSLLSGLVPEAGLPVRSTKRVAERNKLIQKAHEPSLILIPGTWCTTTKTRICKHDDKYKYLDKGERSHQEVRPFGYKA